MPPARDGTNQAAIIQLKRAIQVPDIPPDAGPGVITDNTIPGDTSDALDALNIAAIGANMKVIIAITMQEATSLSAARSGMYAPPALALVTLTIASARIIMAAQVWLLPTKTEFA